MASYSAASSGSKWGVTFIGWINRNIGSMGEKNPCKSLYVVISILDMIVNSVKKTTSLGKGNELFPQIDENKFNVLFPLSCQVLGRKGSSLAWIIYEQMNTAWGLSLSTVEFIFFTHTFYLEEKASFFKYK